MDTILLTNHMELIIRLVNLTYGKTHPDFCCVKKEKGTNQQKTRDDLETGISSKCLILVSCAFTILFSNIAFLSDYFFLTARRDK